MAKDASFDIASEVNFHEVNNAVDQTKKEVENRYDLKGKFIEIELSEKEKCITIVTEDEFVLNAIVDVLRSKCVKREVPLKSLDYQKIEAVGGSKVKQDINIIHGLSTEKAKEIVKEIKSQKFKVQSQVEGEKVRVSGKSIDELQAVIRFLKEKDLGVALQFINFR